MAIEVQAIANIREIDAAGAIGELEPHEISDFFLEVADQMKDPQDIIRCVDRLRKFCVQKYGYGSIGSDHA